jgi:hypothetical protein
MHAELTAHSRKNAVYCYYSLTVEKQRVQLDVGFKNCETAKVDYGIEFGGYLIGGRKHDEVQFNSRGEHDLNQLEF